MSANDNSVNINSGAARESYHHGDLRSALIAAGMSALQDGQTSEDLSLRALARTVGVSATAVYRHFPDKAALMQALALAGLDILWRYQSGATEAALRAGKDAGAAFCASGAAYVRFALDHPRLFELMWQCRPPKLHDDATDEDQHPAMRDLQASIAAMLPASASAEQRNDAALLCWSLVHGLATLALQQQIEIDAVAVERIIHEGTRRLWGSGR